MMLKIIDVIDLYLIEINNKVSGGPQSHFHRILSYFKKTLLTNKLKFDVVIIHF